jgi:hypothetical protein
MTTWYNHAATAFDPETGLFSEDMKALVTNPIAIGEADSTVPLNLLPTVFLGSANTPSGTSVTLSGLSLAPYKTLKVFLNGVSAFRSGSGFNFLIGGVAYATVLGSNASYSGMIEIDLFNGVFGTALADGAQGGISASLTNAATSLTISVDSPATFNGGSFRVYGCK